MILNWFYWENGRQSKRIIPKYTQHKNRKLIKKLIEIFTDEGDVVIDPLLEVVQH